jgi:hypothetical protein
MTFPLFLAMLFGAITVTSLVTWVFSRGDDHAH